MTTLEEKRRKEQRIKTTIPKAIEILSHLSTAGAPKITLDEIDSVKLGIEALKYFQDDRAYCAKITKQKLPGETEE